MIRLVAWLSPLALACASPSSPSSMPPRPEAAGASPTGDAITVAFRVPDPELVPEGIAHDPRTGDFFVGSTHRRSIVRISPRGDVATLAASGQDGLLGVAGMKVDAPRRLLWAASSHAGAGMPMVSLPGEALTEGASALHAYDLSTGRLARSMTLLPDPKPHFLNDLIIDGAGDVWVTDSMTGTVYRTRGDALEPAIDLGAPGANGIALAPDGRTAFVSMWTRFVRVDLATRAVAPVPFPPGVESAGTDGLYVHDGSLISVEPWRAGGKVVRYRLDPELARVVAMDVLVADRPELEQPTTAVIVDDALYLIANSHLQTFRRRAAGEARPDDPPLRELAVLRVRLR